MRQSAVELKNRNNRRDRMLSMENKEWMTKIICYLRTRSVEEQRLEDIRQDITDMLLEAQDRGESADQVLGGNYQQFCDEIVDSLGEHEEDVKSKQNFGIFVAWLPWLGMLVSGFAAFLAVWKGHVWSLEEWLYTMVYLVFQVVIALLIKVCTKKVLDVPMKYFFEGKRIWGPVLTTLFFLAGQGIFYLR